MKKWVDNTYANDGTELTIFYDNGMFELWKDYDAYDAEMIYKGAHDEAYFRMCRLREELDEAIIG